jgi:hypothetical protein
MMMTSRYDPPVHVGVREVLPVLFVAMLMVNMTRMDVASSILIFRLPKRLCLVEDGR